MSGHDLKYPSELEERVEHRGRALLLRPIRADDAARHRRFLARVSSEDLRTRFLAAVHDLPEPDRAHFTRIDYEREMAFIAQATEGAEAGEILGVARACDGPDDTAAEFAVLVRSDLKGRGIGWQLMELIIRYARSENLKRIAGQVLRENTTMLEMCRQLGFEIADDPSDRAIKVVRLAL